MSFSPVSAAHLADLLGRSGQGCALWNAEGLLLMATPAWCQWLDMPEDASPIGQPLQGLMPAQIWQVHGPRFTAAQACTRNMTTYGPVIPVRSSTAAYSSRPAQPMPRAGTRC